MRRISFSDWKSKRQDKKTYTDQPRYKYCGSMFFWYYTIICFSGFNYEIKKTQDKKLRKKFDTEVLLALELVRFTTKYCEERDILKWKPRKWRPKEMSPAKYRLISYKDLTIVWWLIFDKDSKWNNELREILEDTWYEYILDKEPPISYIKFFEWSEDEINKISFKKFLWFLPKDMFIDSTARVLNCNQHVNEEDNDLRKTEILWHSRSEIRRHFRYALREFAKRPSRQEELMGLESQTTEDWINYYAENREKLRDWLEWTLDKNSGRKLDYTRNIYPSSDTWESIMEWILKRIKKGS